MAKDQIDNEEAPCLHCLFVEVIDTFFENYPVSTDEQGMIDTQEVLIAIAKTVAELTASQDAADRENMLDQLKLEIMNYDAEYRQQDELGTAGSGARH